MPTLARHPILKALAAIFALAMGAAAQRSVFLLSVDGLDARYLNDADRLGLKIPTLRRLMREGQRAKGIIGVVPTVTWPSHTTIISGVTPAVHGILGNRRPREEGGDYYWSANLLKVRTLLDATAQAGKTSAAITWPVTVDAPLTYNLPEFFQKRRGGAMDLSSIASKAKPAGLVDEIAATYPTFPQEWMDDRTRTLASIFLVKHRKPDFVIVHFVDLDSEAHDNGPFTRQANAILEYTDEMIGYILEALPPDSVFVLVSDHGFERVDQAVNLQLIAQARNVTGVRAQGCIAIAETAPAAAFIRGLPARYGIGREIPKEEVVRYAPRLSDVAGVFESAERVLFSTAAQEEFSKPHERGDHGHWPTRYRAVYLAWGKGITPAELPEFSQTEIAARIAGFLGIAFQPGLKK